MVMEHEFKGFVFANRYDGLVISQRTLQNEGNFVQRMHFEESES